MARLIINPTAANRRELALSRDGILTVGRDPSNDLVLPDAMVSRRHAVVERRGSQFFLRDCNSANGSVVNGDRVSERGLRDGDLVAIGSTRLLFREEPPEPGAKVVLHPSAAPLRCPSCEGDYRHGDLFCRDCGAQVAEPTGPPRVVCASCGTAVPLPARFCNACGATLDVDAHRGEARGDGVPRSRLDTQPVRSPPKKGGTGVGGGAAAPALDPAPSPSARPRQAPFVRTARPQPPPARPSLPPRPSPPVSSAGLGRRLAAGVVDAIFLLSGQAVLLVPAGYYWWSRELPRTPADVPFLPIAATVALVTLATLMGVLYHIYCWGVRGTSPGKELMELWVEAEDGTCPIGLGRATLRMGGCVLSAASFGIGFLMIASGGGGLHDRIAGTRVVRRTRP